MNPEDPLKVNTVPFGSCIEGVIRTIFDFLRKMKREMMVAEVFVFFFLLHLNSMFEARLFLCLEIDMEEKP